MRPPACQECPLSADCALDDCTPTERKRALTATRRVRDEQRRMLAALPQPRARMLWESR